MKPNLKNLLPKTNTTPNLSKAAKLVDEDKPVDNHTAEELPKKILNKHIKAFEELVE